MRKAIVIGAGGPPWIAAGADISPKSMVEGPNGLRVLDWILASFRQSGIDDIVFVGGFGLDRIAEWYPSLRYVRNDGWRTNNVLESLFCAEAEMAGGFFVSYGDVVFRPWVVERLARTGGDGIAIVVDRAWRRRYDALDPAGREKAELVVTAGGRIARIGKRSIPGDVADGEFIGLALFGPRAADLLRRQYHRCRATTGDRPFHEAPSIRDAFLTDMLQDLVESGTGIATVDVDGGWAEIGEPRDLARFVLGTKAETLDRLRGVLPDAVRIPDQMSFTLADWTADPNVCATMVRERFAPAPIAVRSSAVGEDAWASSLAGAFESVLGVPSESADRVSDAIAAVTESYRRVRRDADPRDQVLVQPMVRDVAMSGVMFTADLETGAPYIVVNYNDTNADTAAVTSGSATATTVYVYRNAATPTADPRLRQLFVLACTLEAVTGCAALDIEFAFDRAGELFVLQVRPIAVPHRRTDAKRALGGQIDEIRAFLRDRMGRRPGVPGPTTVFGDMPDWNPAEMIGTRPNPLALSLYQELITDRAWRIARARIGYGNPSGERLMVSLGGHPYVDVRNSFANLTPARIPADLADRLVASYVAHLAQCPELHDKIEFEIAITCMTFDFETHAGRLRADGFGEDDIATLRGALVALTDDAVSGRREPIDAQMECVATLATRRERLLAEPRTPASIPRIVAALLDDCVEFGTIPFSILARYAFIGTSLLRSLRARGIIDGDETAAFLAGVRTVAGDLVADMDRFTRGELTRAAFLRRYGHLRPGTYDILSARYDERPDAYLPESASAAPRTSPNSARDWAPSPAQRSAIDALMADAGFTGNAGDLLAFIRRAIAAREEAKFVFTHNVSDALALLVEFGAMHEIDRADLAYLDIRDVIGLATDAHTGDPAAWLRSSMARGKENAERWRLVHLPTLIVDPGDIDGFRLTPGRPNYVTAGRVIGSPVFLDDAADGRAPDLAGRIVCIQGADPGYDWIFVHGIAGLITMYGGAASHMTIRCAEFGLPAAIGCGEAIYAGLRGARMIELDCGAGHVHRIA